MEVTGSRNSFDGVAIMGIAATAGAARAGSYDLYLNGRKDSDIPWESFVYAGTGSGTTPVFESKLLNRDEIQYWTRRAYREFYLRPSYPWQRIRRTTSLGDLKVDIKGLSMLLGNIMKK